MKTRVVFVSLCGAQLEGELLPRVCTPQFSFFTYKDVYRKVSTTLVCLERTIFWFYIFLHFFEGAMKSDTVSHLEYRGIRGSCSCNSCWSLQTSDNSLVRTLRAAIRNYLDDYESIHYFEPAATISLHWALFRVSWVNFII
jgi:hypothetical protein